MPLKIRRRLGEAGISQTMLCSKVNKADGQPISVTAACLILGRGIWPVLTPKEWLQRQMRMVLREAGSPHADDDDLFELDEEAQEMGAKPVATIAQHKHPSKHTPKASHVEVEADPELEERHMLTPAARRHFQLFRDPFNTDPECTEDVFMGPDQRYAAESVWEAVRNARLFALVGESGSGKSTLLDDFKDRVRREGLPVRIIQPVLPEKQRLTGIGILEAIVRDLDPSAKVRMRSESLSRQAQDLLADSAQAGMLNVILFEEAHDLSIHALKQLKRFHEFKTGWKRLMSIVLIGQPELLNKLGEHAQGEAREVARRLEIVQMYPLDAELEGYVAHKLGRAEKQIDALFSPDAFDAVRTRLQGSVRRPGAQATSVSMLYPLLINNLLVKALNAAAEVGAKRVDAGIVKGC